MFNWTKAALSPLSATLLAAALTLPGAAFSAAQAEIAGLPGTDDPQARGLAIAQETDRRDLGWGDSKVGLKMILTNAYGETSEREMRFLSLERTDPNIGDWGLIVFDKPRDVDGTTLLTYAKILEPDDQWMYLPAVKRVKRISSVNKSGPFMGSEFAFEDFSATEVGKFSYKWLRDEACGDLQCHVVERTPLYEHSGYTRQVSWIDTTDYQSRKLDYYDRKGDLLKTLEFTDYRLYQDQYWRPHDLYMVNHVTNKTTRLTWQAYEFMAGLDEADFNKNSLKRNR